MAPQKYNLPSTWCYDRHVASGICPALAILIAECEAWPVLEIPSMLEWWLDGNAGKSPTGLEAEEVLE